MDEEVKEKDNKDESQSFGTNKGREIPCSKREWSKEENNNRIGWAASELKSFPLHKFLDMLMIQTKWRHQAESCTRVWDSGAWKGGQ